MMKGEDDDAMTMKSATLMTRGRARRVRVITMNIHYRRHDTPLPPRRLMPILPADAAG